MNFYNKNPIYVILFISGLLVTINWFTWLYAVSTEKLLDASLGYYIFPLLSVFLGALFLNEKLNKYKIIAVILWHFTSLFAY